MTATCKSLGLHRKTARPVCPRGRHGFSIIELIVAAGLLVTVLSVVATLTVRSNRLWQDARHYRLAVDEVSNQLERLTALEEAERVTAISAIEPSPLIRKLLPNPVLKVETLDDSLGVRLVVSLNWDRLGDSVPVTLVGWVDPLPLAANSTAEVLTP